MPNKSSAPNFRRLAFQLAIDLVAGTALGSIPVGRLRGTARGAAIAVPSVVTSLVVLNVSHARSSGSGSTEGGWMPWAQPTTTPDTQRAFSPTDRAGRDDRSESTSRAVVLAATSVFAGLAAGGIVALSIVIDERCERFLVTRGVRRPRLVLGLTSSALLSGMTLLDASRWKEPGEGSAGRCGDADRAGYGGGLSEGGTRDY